ncbi:4-carboxy-4-hydroxy-2-oxoadipate aldolase/oxaloacetate decarboxylase [Sporosarcina obsidiansis]|uniref:4-carboxy-4-hydroxy-2-oxoadipate aldolase/oxaloacetate decarboxylase n=1 Tax=Sporosarcina obsidiansis TaxID=2660748 RepID=UPI00129BCC79|nr:4-carboxy-4-hydroxy-2-oxoadipate aldolase/oxaloacetate decarboxylase [Sporosarcina obsidiansis]
MNKYVIKNIDRPSEEQIKKAEKYDVSTVYEAQGKIGLMDRRIRTIRDGNFLVGPAVTVVCPAGDNLMIHAAIEVCKPGDVLVITTIGESDAGMIGELIVSALMRQGVVGMIIDAGVRDVAQLREMGFPVWSRAVNSRGTTKQRGGRVNSDAVCGGVIVRPGDLILADDDGVVVIKRKDIDESLTASEKRMKKEEGTKARIADGQFSLDFYGLREVLEEEGVVYLDTTNDLKK